MAGASSMLEYALAYARRGWPILPLHEAVLPKKDGDQLRCTCGGWPKTEENKAAGRKLCKTIGKHPRISNGVDGASIDEAVIREWWATWPTAPIALACGGPTGLFVFDVDAKPNDPDPDNPDWSPTGLEALAKLEVANTKLPETVRVKSGGGGQHYYFRIPTGRSIGNRVAMKGPGGGRIAGLDNRSDGGYIILPPSPHASGTPYAWATTRGTPFAEAPTWLVDLLDPPESEADEPAAQHREPPRPPPGVSLTELETYQRAYVLGALKHACERVANPTGKSPHDTMRDESFMIGGYTPHLLDADYAENELLAAAAALKDRDPKEIRRTIHSGILRGAGKSRWPPAPDPARSRRTQGASAGGARDDGPPPPDDRDAPGHGGEDGRARDQGPPPEDGPPPASPDEGEDTESNRRAAAAGSALLVLDSVVVEVERAQDKAAARKELLRVQDATVMRGLAFARIDDPLILEQSFGRLVASGLLSNGEVDKISAKINQQVKAIGKADEAARTDAADTRVNTTADLAKSLGRLAPLANIHRGLQVPRGYACNEQGTWKVELTPMGDEKLTNIIRRPIFISALSKDVDDGGEFVVLSWHDGRAWRTRFVGRGIASVARALADESGWGVPVSSQSAGAVVEYLEAFLAENEHRLPRKRTATVMGWCPDGFLWGDQLIGPDGPVEKPEITMAVEDAGLRQFLAPCRTEGTWEGWIAAVTRARRHPLVMVALLASMAPPLLRIVKTAPNSIFDFAGTTSHGKTTGLRVGASVWGYPNDKDGGLIRPWSSTQVFIERYCTVSGDLPVFLDDTKAVKHTGFIGKILYMIAQGQGKGRGTTSGVQATGTWRTIALSTGEAPATSYAPEGGAAARCLTLWGSPLEGGQSEDNRRLAEALEAELLENFGHAGPRLVAWVQGPEREDWVRERFRAAREKWGALANGNAVAGRASQYVALLDVAEDICRELGIPTCSVNALSVAWSAVIVASKEADKASAALRDVFAHCVQKASNFYGRHSVMLKRDGNAFDLTSFNVPKKEPDASYSPMGGWFGAWSGKRSWQRIAIQPTVLDDFLMERGYDVVAIRRTWHDREWLVTKPGEGDMVPVNINGMSKRCVVITRAAFDQVEDAEGDEDADDA
jgi:hypothetical protein